MTWRARLGGYLFLLVLHMLFLPPLSMRMYGTSYQYEFWTTLLLCAPLDALVVWYWTRRRKRRDR